MLAGLDDGAKVHRTEPRRRGEYNEIHPAVDQLLVRVQPDKLVRHVHFFLMPLLEAVHGALDPVRKHVGHGGQLDIVIGRERLIGRAGATPTAADQPHPDGVAVLPIGAAA